MPTEPKSKHIPRATIQRLATYVQVLENFARTPREEVMAAMREVMSTPPERAQRAAQHLMDAGITSILNFAPARIKTPDHVHVEYVDFFHHLYALAFDHTSQHR